jgi:nucleoside-diphosphate-sugar epimerase
VVQVYGAGHLTERLMKDGIPVRVLDISDESDAPNCDQYIQGDIRDPDAVARACDGIDVIFHCLSQVPIARDRRIFFEVNQGGIRNLLDSSLRSGVSKIVNVSSSAVFGAPPGGVVTDETKPAPLEDYGKAKLAAEFECEKYISMGLDITTIRPRTIVGLGRLGLFELLFDWLADGKPAFTLGSGENIFQFVHLDDVVSACIAASTSPGPEVFNIGGSAPTSMKDTLQAVIDHSGRGSRLVSLPKRPTQLAMKLLSTVKLLPFAPYHWLMYGEPLYFETNKPEQRLGWRPNRSSIEALISSYDWFVKNRDMIASSTATSPHRRPIQRGILRILKRIF